MAYEQRELSGSIFVNDTKEKESHPDFKGSALIDGKAYWVSGWKKKTGAGKTWLSLSFKAKDAQPKANIQDPPEGGGEFIDGGGKRGTTKPAPIDDDLPF